MAYNWFDKTRKEKNLKSRLAAEEKKTTNRDTLTEKKLSATRQERLEKSHPVSWDDQSPFFRKRWGFVLSHPRYLIDLRRDGKVNVTYWPPDKTEDYEHLGTFDTIDDAKKAAMLHHKR